MNPYGGHERDVLRPLDPADPSNPVDPLTPADPAAADPVISEEPASPVNPADPMTPRVPVVQERPMRTWLWPTLLIFGFILGVALVVMLLVSSADFGDEPARVTPTPGSCHPFCTETGAPPAP